MELAFVEWIDSASSATPGWKPLEQVESEGRPLPCRSVGWIAREDAESITLVPHLSGDGERSAIYGKGELGIPRCAILTLNILSTNPATAQDNEQRSC